jgi:cellobiose phosphorylase
MYRLIMESLLGLRLDVDKLYFEPRLPSTWNAFKVHYRFRETVYHITVFRRSDGKGKTSVTVDGIIQNEMYVPLVDDHDEHRAEIAIPI